MEALPQQTARSISNLPQRNHGLPAWSFDASDFIRSHAQSSSPTADVSDFIRPHTDSPGPSTERRPWTAATVSPQPGVRTFVVTSCGHAYQTSATVSEVDNAPDPTLCPHGVWIFDGMEYDCHEDGVQATVTVPLTHPSQMVTRTPGANRELGTFTQMASVPSVTCPAGEWEFAGHQWVCVPYTKTVFTTSGQVETCSAAAKEPSSKPDGFEGQFGPSTTQDSGLVSTPTVVTSARTTTVVTVISFNTALAAPTTKSICDAQAAICTAMIERPYITETTTLAAGQTAFTSVVSGSILLKGSPAAAPTKYVTVSSFLHGGRQAFTSTSDSTIIFGVPVATITKTETGLTTGLQHTITSTVTKTGDEPDTIVVSELVTTVTTVTSYLSNSAQPDYASTVGKSLVIGRHLSRRSVTLYDGGAPYTSYIGSEEIVGVVPSTTTQYYQTDTPGGKPTTSTNAGGTLVIIGPSPFNVKQQFFKPGVTPPSTTPAPSTAEAAIATGHYVWKDSDWFQYPATVTGKATSTYVPVPYSRSTAAPSLPRHKLGSRAVYCPRDQGDVFVAENGTKYQIECYADRAGNDLTTEWTRSIEQCVQKCDQNLRCNDVSFVPPQSPDQAGPCYLKSGQSQSSFRPDIIGARQIGSDSKPSSTSTVIVASTHSTTLSPSSKQSTTPEAAIPTPTSLNSSSTPFHTMTFNIEHPLTHVSSKITGPTSVPSTTGSWVSRPKPFRKSNVFRLRVHVEFGNEGFESFYVKNVSPSKSPSIDFQP